MAARNSHAPSPDPYRVLFERSSTGAARCRLVVEAGRVIGAEVIECNPAFEPVRGSLAALHDMLSRLHESGAPQTLQLRTGDASLSASAFSLGGDEAMVAIEDVTAREQIEQRSRELQDRFDQVFHGNGAAMAIARRSDLRIIDVNPRWLELFEAVRDEVIGKTAIELGLISESAARARIVEHERHPGGFDAEIEVRTRTGAKLTVIASAKPIDIAEGPCTLTTVLNITDRKRAEEAFAAAFSASPAGMLLVDGASDIVVAVNRRLLEMTRCQRADILGRNTDELALILRPSRAELLAELARAGRLDGIELELACDGGPPVWALASTEVITLHDKVHRLSVFTDITARKRLEHRLITKHAIGRRLAETSEVEVAIPHVLEALCRGEGWDCGAIWLVDDTGRALRCAGAWRDPALADAIGPGAGDGARSANPLLERVLETGTPEKVVLDPTSAAHGIPGVGAGMCYAVGSPLLRGSSVLGVVAMAARAGEAMLDDAERGVLESVGRLLGLFIERARAEVALRELNADLERRVRDRTCELEASNRELEAFTSTVSHDLRAPLRAIQGFSEILVEDFGPELPAQARDLVARIHAGGDRLRCLIEDLLEFSRLGRGGLRMGNVELDPLIRSVCDELLVGRDLGNRLDLRTMPLGTCRADASLLRTVWTNLIDNALKYSQHRERIAIEIGRDVRGDDVVYYVRDNGIGFDMAYADRLFGVFERLHSAADFEGTGIGLASIRRIVERHGGRVAATSMVGRGSTFEFTLNAR